MVVDILDLILVSAFTGIGVALGQAVFKLWAEPYVEKLHKFSRRRVVI